MGNGDVGGLGRKVLQLSWFLNDTCALPVADGETIWYLQGQQREASICEESEHLETDA